MGAILMRRVLLALALAVCLLQTPAWGAVTFVAAGTGSGAASGSITPGLPAGFAADDIHVLVLCSGAAQTYGGLTGWTQKIQNNTTVKTEVWWRRAVGGDTGPTVTGSAVETCGQIYGFRGVKTSGDPFSASNSQSNAASGTITAPTITPLEDQDMVLFCTAYLDGASVTASVSGWSGTNPTFTNGNQFNVALTDNLGVSCASGIDTGPVATGARTALANAGTPDNVGALLSLIPAVAATGSRQRTLMGVGT